MASENEPSDIPDLPREDFTSETPTPKISKRDQMVSQINKSV